MDRDSLMLDKFLNLSKKVPIQISTDSPYAITKNTDICFIVAPQWAHFLPPFNIARLSSILLEDGFNAKCFDLNIKCWNHIRPIVKSGEIEFDPWDGSRSFTWGRDFYFDLLHEYMEPVFNSAIEAIVNLKPKVIGFTLYWSNTEPTIWIKNRLKELLPDTIFLAGGPSSHSTLDVLKENFDISVIGEAEKIILDLMYQIEEENLDTSEFPKVLTQPIKQRLDLNTFPIPNYSDFDLNEYAMPNGIVTEFSRGCIAKCTFCEETHFWNYRQKGFMNVVDEIEHLYKNLGITAVWFVDSLVNGSLKDLEGFAKEIIKRDIKINWLGYARHDKRMDLTYFKMLKDSGCIALNYGSESGSNKVLEDMKKRVTKEEMEQNFIDCAKVGIQAVTGWVISFPTETISDIVDTMTLIWRNRNTSISNILSSPRFQMGPQTIVGQNPDRFELLPFWYQECHIRKDFTMAKPHMLVRAKLWSIFLEQLESKNDIGIQPRPNLKKFHYELNYNNDKIKNSVTSDDFNYKIINTKNPFQDSLLNEPFGLLRLLFRGRGGYRLKVLFSNELDLQEFGNYLECGLNGEFEFIISDSGEWTYTANFTYEQPENPFTPYDYFQETNTATLRARKFAKPEWGMDGKTDEQMEELKKECDRLNKEIDFSFSYKDTIKGSWGIKKSLF